MDLEHIEDIYRLSPIQEGMLFHSIAAPASGIYFEQITYRMTGDVDAAAFERAWQHAIARHTILRTAFVWEDLDSPVQIVYKHVPFTIAQENWRALTPEAQHAQLATFLEADRRRGFVLADAPLMRVALFRFGEHDYRFVWSHHHLLLDGWSLALLINEVLTTYAAFTQGHMPALPLSRPYGEYIGWLQEQNLSTAEAFWRHTLQGFSAATQLGIDQGRDQPYAGAGDPAAAFCSLGGRLSAAVARYAQQQRVTMNSLIQGAWAILLSRYSGETDVVFGATTSGRTIPLADVETMIGVFINTLPVRVQVSPSARVGAWLQQLQTQQATARHYEYSPLVQVQAWSEVPRGQPLFESILVFENYPDADSSPDQPAGVQVHDLDAWERTNYPLVAVAAPGPQMMLKLTYDRRRFTDAAIQQMVEHWRIVLEGMVSDPDRRLAELPLLTAAEHQRLLVEWNATRVPFPQRCLHELFEAQVERTPEAVAVVFEGSQLTYRELNRRANQVAHALTARGITSEVLVAVCMERSLELMIGLLAVLKAGGAYVPLDPSYPTERLRWMLEDSQSPVLLTQPHLAEQLPQHHAEVMYLSPDATTYAEERVENLVGTAQPDNLVYVIYTSGSTGQPKGVMISHRALCNHLQWRQTAYPLTADDRILQKTSFSFDASAWELFWPLLVGARLVIARPGGHQDSAYLVKTIAEQQITALDFVPSMLPIVLDEPGIAACTSLRHVFSGSETLPVDVQERFFTRLSAQLHNGYGPTEATLGQAYWTCKPDSYQHTVPIGRPTANMQLYLLDAQIQLVPIGVPGELHIGGVGLARGYLNHPALTAERFIPHPFSVGEPGPDGAGARLYKTGDLARYLPDGNIEYLGRIDQQVKLRGFRIELGEIESVLGQHADVRESAVVIRNDRMSNKQLVAYVVPLRSNHADVSQAESQTSEFIPQLRRYLQTRLPAYMVPATFVVLDALPLLPNGKLNRRALPVPQTAQRSQDSTYRPAAPGLEQTIAATWQEVLQIDQVGAEDHFFDLGGHSLLLVQVLGKLRERVKADITMLDLFEYPTIRELAQRLGATSAEQPAPVAQPERGARRTEDLQHQRQLRQERRARPGPTRK